MKAAELIQRGPGTISVDATLADAVEALAGAHGAALAVIDRFGRAVGVVSTRSVVEAERGYGPSAAERANVLETTLVLEIMDPWPPTVSPDVDVREVALALLRDEGQPVFVEHEGELRGVIAQSDIVRAVAEGKLGSTPLEPAAV